VILGLHIVLYILCAYLGLILCYLILAIGGLIGTVMLFLLGTDLLGVNSENDKDT